MIRLFIILLFIISANAFETKSDEISFDLNNKSCILQGNAEIKFNLKSECLFKADYIKIKCKDKDFKAPEEVFAEGNIVFSNGDISIKSKKCRFDMVTIDFFENVAIKNSELGEITADNALYNLKTKKLNIASKDKVKLKINDDKSEQIIKRIKK